MPNAPNSCERGLLLAGVAGGVLLSMLVSSIASRRRRRPKTLMEEAAAEAAAEGHTPVKSACTRPPAATSEAADAQADDAQAEAVHDQVCRHIAAWHEANGPIHSIGVETTLPVVGKVELPEDVERALFQKLWCSVVSNLLEVEVTVAGVPMRLAPRMDKLRPPSHEVEAEAGPADQSDAAVVTRATVAVARLLHSAASPRDGCSGAAGWRARRAEHDAHAARGHAAQRAANAEQPIEFGAGHESQGGFAEACESYLAALHALPR
jgi:hypothetical protein